MFAAPNYTQIPNEFLDKMLPNLTPIETKVLLVIMRKTLGWHKPKDRISLSQFEKLTGSGRQAIIKAQKSLVKKKLIVKTTNGEKGSQESNYELNVIEDSNNPYQCDSHTTPQCDSNTPPSVILTHTKETLTKEKKESNADSAAATSLSKFLLEKIKKQKDNFSGDVTTKWIKYSERLLKNRQPSELRKVIDWVYEDPFWSGVVLSPMNLLKNLDKIEMQMIKKNSYKESPLQNAEANKFLAKQIENQFSNHPDIVHGHNYIEFKIGRDESHHIKFSDNGFEEQVRNNLRKLQLRLSDGR